MECIEKFVILFFAPSVEFLSDLFKVVHASD